MVYESGYTTRRTYTTSRPVVSSYTVSVPSVQRVYKTSYPIYSTYSTPRRYVSGSTRIITSPIRVVASPARVITRVVRSPSPVRVVRTTTTRVVSSPERTVYSSSYTSPSYYNTSSSYVPSSYTSYYTPHYSSTYTTPSYIYSSPSYLYTSPVVSRVYSSRSVTPVRTTHVTPITTSYLRRNMPGYGARALSSYINTEPFETFRAETNRIRHRAESLVRDIHTPVTRARSCTPFAVGCYEPASKQALDAYVARVTNPNRHIAKEVHNMSHYLEPARKYVGKSHLASVRICGDRAYNVRKPMWESDSDKVRTDINLMSWYLRHPSGKIDKKVIKEVEKIVNEDAPVVSDAAVEVEA